MGIRWLRIRLPQLVHNFNIVVVLQRHVSLGERLQKISIHHTLISNMRTAIMGSDRLSCQKCLEKKKTCREISRVVRERPRGVGVCGMGPTYRGKRYVMNERFNALLRHNRQSS